MSVFDVNNPPAFPDSELDSDLSLVKNVICDQGTKTIPIAPGDWVDMNPDGITADPEWGWSFQVCQVYKGEGEENDSVDILMTSDNGESYSVQNYDCYWVTNNFRRVPEL